MSAKPENIRAAFAEQLENFDQQLNATVDDVDMLADIQTGIGNMLATSGSSEGEIRKILQERYDEGDLRKETFQLVKSMLDRYVTENVATLPTTVEPAKATAPTTELPVSSKVDFGTTAVIPVNEQPKDSADSRVQVGSLLRDRFLLQEKISGGSMGVVYKALDRRLAESGRNERWVAIKVLSPQLAENGQALRALQQEAAKGRCLVHPNIVRFIDLDREGDLYFLIMEWLTGRTLADVLDSKDRSAVDHDAAFKIVGQIGEALDYAHRCGIVHADVKPGNIMMMPNGDAKLFDFGVARVRQQHAESEFDPGVLGALTPAYSSMQVLTGEEPTAADDVFSLACLLYRLLAGYRVFGPRNAAEASQEGMQPQPLKAVSEGQWRALQKALSYARVTRFNTVREFMDALDEKGEETISFEAPDRFEEEQSGGFGKWVLAFFLVAVFAGAAAYKLGYVDSWLQQTDSEERGLSAPGVQVEPEPEMVAPEPITEVPVVEQETTDSELPSDMIVDDIPDENEVGPASLLVDFSALPPASVVVSLAMDGAVGNAATISLREDGKAAIVDFVRAGELTTPLSLRLEEVGFSGNQSPWATGQYAFSNAGLVHFPSGQERARVTFQMASDPLREADQQSTLRLREVDFAAAEYALLRVSLEDDDQRRFESSLPANTVAFAASQASIREQDPAVQIDVIRFNPDNTSLLVNFSINDITATEGSDYFAPGSHSIMFGPGQRAARLLIPLVQDAEREGDEAFVIQLTGIPQLSAIDVYQRIVVMIRDDEPQAR